MERIFEFEDKIKKCYYEYLKLPLSTLDNKTEIYENRWCVITGLGFVSPDPHRYYTLIEFAYWFGKDKALYNRFIY